ncbi:MAG TPA: Ig-like domain-containing protein, partial [Gemmatimonadaceae bacterium]|nr:Ig-like domain-containing protein [Gemmatimonadaceae bacterium]
MRPHVRASSIAVFLIVAAAVACLDTSAPLLDTPHSAASISIEPTSASVHIGGTVSFDAAVRDASGNAMSGAQVTWRSSDTTIAIVSATGQVTPRRVGTASITASSDQQSGAASLTVLPAAVASLALSPTSASLMTGDTMQFSATPRDGDGNVLAGRSVSWTSSNPAIVTVSSTGLAIAKAQGSAQVTATSDSVEESAPVSVVGVIVDSVEVSPAVTSIVPGQSAQFSATLLDSRGRPMKGSVEWSVDDSALASVTATGVVTAKSAGTATVVATSGKKHGNAKLQIANVAVAAVIVSPGTLSLSIGKTSQLAVTLKDSAGNVLTGRTVSWSSSNSSAVSVSSTGVVAGVAAGTATITATSDSRSGAALVTVPVNPPTVASISVTPSTLTIIKGKTSQLTATPRDSAGTVLAGQTITWATSTSSVATISSAGVVTAVATGTATITAASNGHSDSSAITVVNAPVASVAETPDSATIIIGGTVQLSASALDSSGNVLTGRTITWSAADSTIASVSASGLVKGVVAGLTQVYATSEGKRDSTTITVAEAPAASVAVTPSSVSLVVGASKQASATVRDANGNVLTGQTVTWKSSATGVATVSSNGMIQAVAVGSATVTATSGGKSGTAGITVTQVPVATVSLSPTSATLSVGGTQQLTATLKDSANNVLSGRTITWQSSSTSVATVSSSGVVTAIAAGSAVVKATSESKSATASITVSGGTGATSHSGWYVTPNGSSGGAGTASSPWNLTTALAGAGGRIHPGDTVWMRAGTYGSGGY